MTTFRKVAFKPSGGRDKLGRINARVSKHSKTPAIVKVHDLDLNSPTTSLISRILPQIEKVSSYNFPKPVKSAIIANIVDQAAQSIDEELSSNSRSSSPQRSVDSSPKFSTPAVKSPKRKDSFLHEISHLFNSAGQILDSEGQPIPGSDIDRAASWMKKSTSKSRVPPGIDAIAFDLAQRTEMPKHIRNPNFFNKTNTINKGLTEVEIQRMKRQAKFLKNRLFDMKGAGKWQSLGIRY